MLQKESEKNIFLANMLFLLKSDPKSDLHASKRIKKNAFNMHMTDERSSIEIHFPDLLSTLESFNNYVDQILTNFDPLPSRVDKHGHFTSE